MRIYLPDSGTLGEFGEAFPPGAPLKKKKKGVPPSGETPAPQPPPRAGSKQPPDDSKEEAPPDEQDATEEPDEQEMLCRKDATGALKCRKKMQETGAACKKKKKYMSEAEFTAVVEELLGA